MLVHQEIDQLLAFLSLRMLEKHLINLSLAFLKISLSLRDKKPDLKELNQIFLEVDILRILDKFMHQI